jgi:hypothetical protein
VEEGVASVRRVLAVTAGLAATGLVVGAVLGAVVEGVALMLVGHEVSGRDTAIVIGAAAAAGGVLGMLLAPTAAWLLMRHVPIGRALAETALGTTLGAFAGFLLTPSQGFNIASSPLTLALVGFTAAAVRLRFMHRKKDTAAILPPDD